MSGPTAGLWLSEERSPLEAIEWLDGCCSLRVEDEDTLEITIRKGFTPTPERSCGHVNFTRDRG